jgi:hypothetical protein
VTDIFGTGLPQQDVEFLAGFLLMDILDQFFGGFGGGMGHHHGWW